MTTPAVNLPGNTNHPDGERCHNWYPDFIIDKWIISTGNYYLKRFSILSIDNINYVIAFG